MKLKSIDNVVFIGLVLILIYQYTLLYLSIIDGSWTNFVVVAAAFGIGLLLGRTTYVILGGVLSFISISAGGLMLAMPYTRDMYFWGAVALVSITPVTAYLMFLLNHQVLKRKALAETISALQRSKPDLELVTGRLNRHALKRALCQEFELVTHHASDYHFTLTLVKIDFLENLTNYLGSKRFNGLLRTTADHLAQQLYPEDQLYYLGTGRFVILSPMLADDDASVVQRRIKKQRHVLEQELELGQRALVLRTGQATFAARPEDQSYTVESVLARLERDAETDIVKEYY